MTEKSDMIIGVMSGSSLDGLDMVACRFDETTTPLTWEIDDAITVPFTPEMRESLRSASSLSGFDLMHLDAEFGKYIGHQINTWIDGKSWNPALIASHGHTVFHEPARGFTTQIGSGAHIMATTGIGTVARFRETDVAFGGQGAPFAPAGDRELFPEYDGYLNLGGIANVHLLSDEDEWLAWDIVPCNQALNYLAGKEGMEYDMDGMYAAKGAVLDAIRHDLVAMYPFRGGKPFSLSNQQVRSGWLEYLSLRQEDSKDLMASTTLAIHDVITIHLSTIIKRPARVLLTGGGAHNKHLVELLQRSGTDYGITYEIPDRRTVDHKESILMAFLGWKFMHRKPFGINSITGAGHDSIGGAFYPAV